VAQTVKITPASGLLEFIGNTTSNKPYLQHDDNGNLTLTLQATKKFTVAGNLKVNGKVTMAQQTLTDGAAITWDFNSGANAKVTIAGARTLVLSNMETGDTGLILVKQDAAGSRTLTLPGSSSIVGGGTYTASPAAGATDVLGVYYDGTTYWWTIGYNTVSPPITSIGITGADFTIANSPLTANGNIGLALATVNSTVGTFGSATAVPVITVNAKGLVTAVSATNISIPTNLDSLTDVTITSAATGQLLQFNGSQWVNWTPNYITLTSLSGSTGISYNNTTGAISSTITQYTDALARAAHSFTAGSGAYNATTGVITIPTNTNQLTNGAGYITSYAETDTLASVTGRGATTNTASVFAGGLYARKAQGDGDYTTAALWTESYNNTTTGIAFHISGVVGKFLEMRLDQRLYWDNSQVWTAGNLTNLNQLSNGPAYITTAALSGYATQTYVNTAVSNLVASAPSTLDTLNELATALGNDANFATTITTSIGNKVSKSGDTMTGNLAFGATSGLGLTWGLNTDAAFIKFISTGNQAGGSYLEIGTQDDSNEEIKFTQSGVLKFYLATDGNLKTGSGYNYVWENGTWAIGISGNAATATNVAWTGVTGRPTALSQFSNDLGNYGGWLTQAAANPLYVNVGGDTMTGPLVITGSTSGQELFAVNGVNGRLFTVSDDLSNSLFSVNTVAGLPVIEAFANNTVNIGPFSAPIVINASGISTPSHGTSANWNSAYNDTITSAAVSGTTSKTLTLTQRDGGTVTATWTDIDTDTNTDAQTLSVSGSTLTISGGNSITLPTGGISQATADGLYVNISGDEMTGNLYISPISANPAQIQLAGSNPELYVSAKTGTARVFISRQGTGHQATLMFMTGMGTYQGTAWDYTGAPMWSMGMTNNANTNSFKLGYGDIYDPTVVALEITTANTAYFKYVPYAAGNLLATQSWVTSQGYITGYTETDTLASVTGRGATTSTALSLNGKVTFSSTVANRPQFPGGILGLDTSDGNFDIWGISRDYYPSHPTPQNAWGLRWNGDNNDFEFVGAGTSRVILDMDGGNITTTGKISVGTTYAGFAANIAGTVYIIGGDLFLSDGYLVRNASNNSSIAFNNSALSFTGAATFSSTISASNFSGTHSGASSGTNTGDQTNISGNAATATYATSAGNAATAGYSDEAKWISFPDGPRDLSDRLPNWNNRSVAWDFVGAGTANGSGNYGGVMTFSPWDGTSGSTGDSSYQLAFANTTGVNASGQPKLSIRNGINSTWNAWYTLIHSGNIGSQSVSYATTAGALTSMNISQFTNNSGYLTSVSDIWVDLAGDTMTGILRSSYNTATGIANNGFNVAKTIIGNFHIRNGNGTSGNNAQAAITFQGGAAGEAQAGIYVSNNDSTGTAMGFATTDSYSTGPQLFMAATCFGVVNFPRATPTVQGNTVWHAGNDGAGSGLDADLLDGYTSDTAANVNTIVRRDSSGNIYSNYVLGSYFNASAGNSENPTIGQIWTQNTSDNYLRKSTPGHFRSQVTDSYYLSLSGGTLSGNLNIIGELAFRDGAGGYSNIIRAAAYPSEGYPNGTNYWMEYRAYGGHHFVLNTDGGVGGGANTMDDFVIWQGAIDGDRLLEVSNTGTLTIADRLIELSSIRYKTQVESLTPALDKVLQLRPVHYVKIGGTGETEIGLIAEEVAEIYPELVKYNSEGQVDGINYTRIAPILLKTIQEQHEIIKKLTERIENLENR